MFDQTGVGTILNSERQRTLELNDRFKKSQNIVYKEEDDGAFLFNSEDGNLKFMNHTAKAAFLLLEAGKDVSEIVNEMTGVYPEIDANRIQEDVESLLKELQGHGFVGGLEEK